MTAGRTGTTAAARRARGLAAACALAAAAVVASTAQAGAATLTSERWWGADRHATAASVSARAVPDGATDVVVVSGGRFADALAGAPLAALHEGPLLTVDAGGVPAATRAELARLRPQVVRVVGGTAAVSDDVLRQLSAYAPRVVRLQGEDRYATAAAVARTEFAGQGREVVVASGEDFPDALAGGAAGAALGSPLVLTARGALPEATRAAVAELAPTRITLVGGPAVVSPAVQAQLEALTPGAVVRLSGDDRYATAVAVARDTWESAPSPLLASGEAFPDALAGAALGAPLLLSRRDCLPPATADAYAALGVHEVTGLGGTAALSEAALRGDRCR